MNVGVPDLSLKIYSIKTVSLKKFETLQKKIEVVVFQGSVHSFRKI
jgi:hypothetical protein